MDKTIREICRKAVEAAKEVYGDKLDTVFLYGSYARGDFTDESDVDIAIIVELPPEELNKLCKKFTEASIYIGYDENKLVNIVDLSKQNLDKYKDCLPYYKNIIQEGIKLYDRQ